MFLLLLVHFHLATDLLRVLSILTRFRYSGFIVAWYHRLRGGVINSNPTHDPHPA
jgi:hypothetical protein